MANGLCMAKGPLKTQYPSHRDHGTTLITAGTLGFSVKKLKTMRELVCDGGSGAAVKTEVTTGSWAVLGQEGGTQGLCTEPLPSQVNQGRG